MPSINKFKFFATALFSTATLIPIPVSAHGNPDIPHFTEEDIINIIDERLTTIKRQKGKEKLSALEGLYQLASKSTPNNQLIYGNLNARITLHEFGDIECPFCRQMHAGIKQVIDYSEGVINWEFKHYPLEGHNPASAVASQTIECINEYYGNRASWIALERFILETKGNGKGIQDIPNFVRTFGLNGSLIGNCLASDDHKEKINNDYKEGKNYGVTGTPALMITDHQSGRKHLIKGKKTPEEILQAVQNIIRK